MKYGLLFLVVITLLSCRHDSETPLPDQRPTISLEAKPGYISGTTIIRKNTAFYLSINAESNSSSQQNLKQVIITRSTGYSPITEADTLFNSNKFEYLYSFTSLLYADTEKWTITVIDQAGQSNQTIFNMITINYPPALTVVYPLVPMGTSVPFSVAIHAASNNITNLSLKRITVYRSTFSNTLPFFDSTLTGKSIVLFKEFETYNETITETFRITTEDNGGETNTYTFKVYVASFMLDENEGIIYNSLSGQPYGWDLILNLPRTDTDNEADIDMYNFTDIVEFGAPYFFNNGWFSGNATRYKRANWYDYDNATTETAVDAFSGGTITDYPATQATAITTGDIYIANLRNQNNWCVIKITEVNRTTGDNQDYIRFTYKKQ
ncbi:MAG: hypothetical protein CVU05_10305 [Bacteroidetes bacterium HGW-Bacteroidetes-21]|jgi:hypothetical protein|nr:MAG: hypothetical protein CVU05_10305 [Bacteroidetes bacterium HGW-Bacteroidetes-21]